MASEDDDMDFKSVDSDKSNTPETYEDDSEEEIVSDDDFDEEPEVEGNEEESSEEDAVEEKAAEASDRADRKKRSAQERIRELARARRELERAAYEAEMRAKELERRLQERETTNQASQKTLAEPNPKDFRYGEVDPDYINAMVEYRVVKREAELRAERETRDREEREQAEIERYRRRLQEVLKEGTAKYPGFREAVDNTPFDPELARMILDSEKAVDIAYHLSKNVSDLRDLTRANPQERWRKLGQLEGKLSATSAAKKTSNAPRTPSAKGRRPAQKDFGRYGPDDQDEFDRVFFGR